MIGKDKTRLILTLSKKQAKELKKLAKKKKCPVSEYIRQALDFYILKESLSLSSKPAPSEEPLQVPPEMRGYEPSTPSEQTRQKAKAKKKAKKKAKRK